MKFQTWMNKMVKRLEWYDISLVKISVFAFALMAAKLYTPLLSLDWHWYGIICVLAAIPVWMKMFK